MSRLEEVMGRRETTQTLLEKLDKAELPAEIIDSTMNVLTLATLDEISETLAMIADKLEVEAWNYGSKT